MPPPELTLQARYVFPVEQEPISEGVVRIVGERITYVGVADRTPDVRLGNAAILPGLVNPHTHLELSALSAKNLHSSSFAEWLRRVVHARRDQAVTVISHAIQRGIDELLTAGTTLVGDISTKGLSWRPLLKSPLRAIVFCELIGLVSERAIETANTARRWLEEADGRPDMNFRNNESDGRPHRLTDGTIIDPLPTFAFSGLKRRLIPSLSPHSPYSTDLALYDLAADWGHTTNIPICTHLAETEDELQLLQHRNGPLRKFLESIGAWEDAWQPAGSGSVDYLKTESTRDVDWLLAHGNYLNDEEIATLGQTAKSGDKRRTIVYCPRTHAYFAHRPHPYQKLLAAGIRVCLGTDSAASSPNLSILAEMRFLHRRDESISGAALLRMGTLDGAWGLRQERSCGSIAPGKFADLTIIRLPDIVASDPHQLVLESREPVIGTMIGGSFVFRRLTR